MQTFQRLSRRRFSCPLSSHSLNLTFQPYRQLHAYSHTIIPLPSRSILQLSGSDSVKFLQGLITNCMSKHNSCNGLYTAFLNHRGRMLADAFIIKNNENNKDEGNSSVLIDCDSRIKRELMDHLVKYKLRSDVSIFDRSNDFTVVVKTSTEENNSIEGNEKVKDESEKEIEFVDPRHHSLGIRAIIPTTPQNEKTLADEKLKNELGKFYHLRRCELGIGEGVDDFTMEKDLPLECNLDFVNAIDFEKGCYLGQELTIRTHNLGQVRKRIVPIQISKYPEFDKHIFDIHAQIHLKPGSQISAVWANVPNAGVVKIVVHNYGLALLRFGLIDPKLEDEFFTTTDENGEVVYIKAFVPDWWPKSATA